MSARSTPRRRPRRAGGGSPTNTGRERSQQEALPRYRTEEGVEREIITRPRRRGRTLVIDRDSRAHRDPRLIAALSQDEPSGSAALVARMYVADPAGRFCRRLEADDLFAPDGDPP